MDVGQKLLDAHFIGTTTADDGSFPTFEWSDVSFRMMTKRIQNATRHAQYPDEENMVAALNVIKSISASDLNLLLVTENDDTVSEFYQDDEEDPNDDR